MVSINQRTLKRGLLRILKKYLKNDFKEFERIEKEFSENTDIAKEIMAFALANPTNFKAIGDFTIQKLNIDLSKYDKKTGDLHGD